MTKMHHCPNIYEPNCIIRVFTSSWQRPLTSKSKLTNLQMHTNLIKAVKCKHLDRFYMKEWGLLGILHERLLDPDLLETVGYAQYWSGGSQLTDPALSVVDSVEASFDASHRGPKLCCCFEESESDCNGPSCAPACLPLRFTTHLIFSPQTLSHNCTLHTHFLPHLSLLSLSFFVPPPSIPRHLFTSAHVQKKEQKTGW